MINFIKKHKVLSIVTLICLVFDVIIGLLALIPANKDIISPGGLNTVSSVINVNNDTNINGSFNTIYVYSMERVSVLEVLVGSLSSFNDIDDSSETIHLSTKDNQLSGQIQKNQSIEASLICAYQTAKEKDSNINLDYNFKGFIVYIHQINHNVFKVGDIITKVNDNDTSDINKLADAINNLKIGDVITYFRDEEEMPPYVVDTNFKEGYQMFYCYSKYEINQSTATPSFTLLPSKTLGPSGGLMQTLSIYSQITGKDYTFGRKIAGTGTISVSGNVGEIGGITQKIVTAIYNNVDLFLCPAKNYDEALKAYNKTPGHENMILVKVETFKQAISALEEYYGNN